ncbi:MAG: phenylacetate--CoA ligase family protein [Bacteroidales bacterium]
MQFLEETQYWSQEKLLAYQNKRLNEFVAEIYYRVPIYKNNPEYLKLSKDNLDIQHLPILTKKFVKQNVKEFYNIDDKKIIWGKTSGTTGSPMIFPITRDAMQKVYAFRNMHYSWNGLCLHNREKIAMISGHPVSWHRRSKPPYWSFDMVNNHLYFSSYHLSESNLKYYIEKLEEFDPLLLHGYPSSIYLLALAYEKFGTKKLALKGIYTSSETLLDFQRHKIQNAFQVKVFNFYGTSEMNCNIVECEKGELHLKSEYSYVEILNNDNQACKPGERGRIISTHFNNTAFPLIRYDVGDNLVISNNQVAKCGRSGLLIDYIEGRNEDYVITPEGRIIGRLSILLKDAINVIEAQIEQPCIEEVVLRIVRNNYYSKKDEVQIKHAARARLGNSIKISFDYVDEIPRASNGKFRFVISKIDPLLLKTIDLN